MADMIPLAPMNGAAAKKQPMAAIPAGAKAEKKVELKFITPENAARTHIRIVVAGIPGIGKTSLLRTIPENESVFTISAEGGLLSVSDLVASGRVQGVEITTMEEMDEVLALLEGPRRGKYDWVFIDSITEIAGISFSQHYNNDLDKSTFHTWTGMNEQMRKILRRLKNLTGRHIVVTCLELKRKPLEGPEVHLADVPGTVLKTLLANTFDDIYFMVMGMGGKRLFVTRPGRYPAKTRCAAVLNDTEPADLGLVRDKIMTMADIKENTDA
jgi:nucleoside-triphosphatase THEP1